MPVQLSKSLRESCKFWILATANLSSAFVLGLSRCVCMYGNNDDDTRGMIQWQAGNEPEMVMIAVVATNDPMTQ